MLKIGYFQFAPSFGNVRKNLDHIVANLRDSDADIVVLPELCFTGYYFANRKELLSLAEDPRHSATVDSLTALCRERRFYIVAGFAERAQDVVFNSALLIGPEGHQSTYRKLHLFKDEKDLFRPGDIPLQPVEVVGVTIGMMVCFDWAFPEVARTLSLKGVEVLCHPSNLILTYCQQAMLARCVENGVFAVTCNRCGSDDRPHGRLDFTGQSQIIGPKAEVLHRSPADQEEVCVLTIDPTLARTKGITDRNDLFKDRRPEFYSV